MEEGKAAPARYLLKFESFSELSTHDITKYESSVFDSSGYKWKMIIYPAGDGSEDGKDHISVYLAIAETSSLAAGWEVNATFSFLLFDQIRDKYIVLRGMEGRFHNIVTKRGLPKFVSLEKFKESSNGYLVNDNCIFGIDVYVIKNQLGGECVSLFSGIKTNKHEWKISEFTKSTNVMYSEEFTAGEYKWQLKLYPTGISSQKGQSISLFLVSVDAKEFDCRERAVTKFSISVKDQISGADVTKTVGSHWFTAAAAADWGWSAFMAISKFKDPKNGFLVNDCCIVEADVSVLYVVSGLT